MKHLKTHTQSQKAQKMDLLFNIAMMQSFLRRSHSPDIAAWQSRNPSNESHLYQAAWLSR
jgi:hypothetical protein